MREMTKWLWIAGAPALIAGCAVGDQLKTSKASSEPLELTPGLRVSTEGILSFGAVVFAENPTTLMEAGDFHGYELDGKAGGSITITATASSCGNPDTVVDLFGPEDANGNRLFLAENDDSGGACFTDSQIAGFMLPDTGRYLVVVTSFLQEGGNGHYKLQVTCNNGMCVDPTAPTFAASQIAQTDIDAGKFTPAQLFDIGDFTFEHIFRENEGMGNALAGLPGLGQPRPDFRQFPNNVHFAGFGAPEAQSCVTCHNLGGDDGAGDLNHTIFQIGDGINRSSGVPRNAPTVLGNGYRQAIGAEMTIELQGELAAATAKAKSTNMAVTQALTSKGISFGSLVANPDGTVNFAGVVGVDTVTVGAEGPLTVRPFGWKGRESTLRRFVEGGFRVHFGMQSQPSIDKNCANPNVNNFGNGPDCQDPDADGVKSEITEGLLSAEAVYMGLRETPVRVPAATPAAATRASSGEALFKQIGCTNCHVQNMKLNSPIHVEPADETGGAGIKLNLATDNKTPHPASNADGSITVELWSDFKRHDVGTLLADSKPFNQIAANQFITPPLWGIADSAPYLHDGRAPTLSDAIIQHAGDALSVEQAYGRLTADQQAQIQEFLGTLGRQEDADAKAAPVDLSGYTLEQEGTPFVDFTIPAGTLVPHGGFLIIARNTSKSAFQTFYGKTLGANVVYLNSAATTPTGSRMPQISGGQAFMLFDTQFVTVDGPSIAEPTGGLKTFSRTSCAAAAGAATSWVTTTTTTAIATPGTGPVTTNQGHVCITEIADATTQADEYLEIFVE